MWDDRNLMEILSKGGVAVMPTDTLYGVVGQAENIATVERIYKVRKRASEKPCIVLIGNLSDLEKFSITVSEEQKIALNKYWLGGLAGPVSIVLNCLDEKFSYLHRGTKTLAFRLPAQTGLQNLLKKTGPLIAPSANPEGLPPAQTIAEAKNYFGDLVDLYIDGGSLAGQASKVIKLHKNGLVDILRP
jgi:L-threonylcarbamoyladenylate synthase